MKKLAAFIIFIIFTLALLFLYNTNRTPKSNLIPQSSTQNPTAAVQKNLQVGLKPEGLSVLDGFKIGIFAKDLPNARDLQFTPLGTLFVSLTASGKVIALPDKDDNGVADDEKVVLSGLRRPHGMAFYKGKLYVAEENKVVRYNYDENTYTATYDKKLFDLPLGGRHFTRSLLFDKDGNLYVSVGSTCDTCVEKSNFLASVLVSNSEGENLRVYSNGLRNAVFMALNPTDDKVYVTEMGRDYLGDITPPDEIDILQDGGNYGWPYCYGDKVWDKTFGKKDQSYCDSTLPPYFKIHAHSAPLGISFINSPQMNQWNGDLMVAYHGSIFSSVPVGYKVVVIKTGNNPSEEDFITGFSKPLARPVDVTFDHEGSLYVSDDKAGAVYKIVKSGP